MQAKGDAMMSKWAEVMTNMRPKTYFLRPDVALPLGFALVREFWNQKVGARSRRLHHDVSNWSPSYLHVNPVGMRREYPILL